HHHSMDLTQVSRPTTDNEHLTHVIDDRRAILLADLNWQVANGLSYFGERVRPELAVDRARDVLLYAPSLIRDNLDVGRQVVASERAQQLLAESYGPLLESTLDADAPSFAAIATAIPRGTRYAVCVLNPQRDLPIDRTDLETALRALSPGIAIPDPLPAYAAVAGVAGAPAALAQWADFPFRHSVEISGTAVDIRMES